MGHVLASRLLPRFLWSAFCQTFAPVEPDHGQLPIRQDAEDADPLYCLTIVPLTIAPLSIASPRHQIDISSSI